MLSDVPDRDHSTERGPDTRPARTLAAALAWMVVLLIVVATVWAAATLPPAYEGAAAMAPRGSDAERAADEQAISDLRDYLSGESARLETRTASDEAYFNAWERRHLHDVRARVDALPTVVAALAALALTLAVLLAAGTGPRSAPAAAAAGLRSVLRAGAGLGIGLLLACVVSFPTLWNLFHLAVFDEPTWVLDPARDRLLELFPLGFWAALGLGIGAVVVAALAALVLVARRVPSWGRRAPGGRTVIATACGSALVLVAIAAASLAWPLGEGAVACRTLHGDDRRAECARERTRDAASRIGESRAQRDFRELLRHDRRLRAAIGSEAPDRSSAGTPRR